MGRLNTREAAKVIGCSISNVRYLCRTNKMRSKLHTRPDKTNYYTILDSEVTRYRDIQSSKGGWPRGKPRRWSSSTNHINQL